MTRFGAPDEVLAHIYRKDASGVLSVLISQLRDFDLAEDALHDAIAQAVVAWRRTGPPRNGAAWLLTAARRRAIDRIRKSSRARDDATQRLLLAQLENQSQANEEDQPIPDERLRLIFTCCHPALSQEARVALTLRTLCGLSTQEIARAYLVSDATMSQRIVRAKAKIRDAAIPYEVPEGPAQAERLSSVLDVIYLIFNEGFAATEGESPTRADLCIEAIRLGRLLYQLKPHPESGGLLALMMLHDARRGARTDSFNEYIPISEQDRSLWNQELIAQGTQLLHFCLGQKRPAPFQIQAAISAVHSEAAHAEDTDWPQIAGLYRALEEATPSPVVTLNRAVAVAHAHGTAKGLALLETVAQDLDGYQPFYAAQAELLRRSGQLSEAATAYTRAIDLSTNTAERTFLIKKRSEITAQA